MQLNHAPPSSRSAGPRDQPCATAPRPKGRVLVVDDEPRLLGAYHRILRAAGYEVTAASDGRHALEILDVGMPGLDGIELMRAAGRVQPDVPFILVTGSPTSEATTQAVAGGALLYLIKPIDARTLVQIVNHATRLHR
jgi:DNA-binding NtrC family response regulator